MRIRLRLPHDETDRRLNYSGLNYHHHSSLHKLTRQQLSIPSILKMVLKSAMYDTKY